MTGAFNSPIVACCGRDAADCDCLSTWGAAPAKSLWYGEVICEPIAGGDVDYFYDYSTGTDEPDPGQLVPKGWRELERTVRKTPGHPEYEGPDNDDND